MKLSEKLRTLSWKTYLKVALCLCAAVVLGWFAGEMLRPSYGTVEKTRDGVTVHFPVIQAYDSSEEYRNGLLSYIYTDTAFYFQVFDSNVPLTLIGKKVGEADLSGVSLAASSGMISFTGTFRGDIHAVEGYDPAFMLCSPGQFGGVFIRNGGFSVKYGSDIFRDELHLPGEYTDVYIQKYATKYNSLYNDVDPGEPVTDYAAVEQLLAEICEAEFRPAKRILNDGNLLGYLHFRRTDGTGTTLCLYRGGYVALLGIDRICVRVKGDAFDAVVAFLA